MRAQALHSDHMLILKDYILFVFVYLLTEEVHHGHDDCLEKVLALLKLEDVEGEIGMRQLVESRVNVLV